MRKFIIAVASLLVFSSACFAQKKDPVTAVKDAKSGVADLSKSVEKLGKSIDKLQKTVDEMAPPPVDKDTQIAVLKIQKEQVQIQAQFTHDQQEMQQLQQQFQKDAQDLLGLKLKAEAAEQGKYELDLSTLTFKPNPAKPADAPKKN